MHAKITTLPYYFPTEPLKTQHGSSSNRAKGWNQALSLQMRIPQTMIRQGKEQAGLGCTLQEGSLNDREGASESSNLHQFCPANASGSRTRLGNDDGAADDKETGHFQGSASGCGKG